MRVVVSSALGVNASASAETATGTSSITSGSGATLQTLFIPPTALASAGMLLETPLPRKMPDP